MLSDMILFRAAMRKNTKEDDTGFDEARRRNELRRFERAGKFRLYFYDLEKRRRLEAAENIDAKGRPI